MGPAPARSGSEAGFGERRHQWCHLKHSPTRFSTLRPPRRTHRWDRGGSLGTLHTCRRPLPSLPPSLMCHVIMCACATFQHPPSSPCTNLTSLPNMRRAASPGHSSTASMSPPRSPPTTAPHGRRHASSPPRFRRSYPELPPWVSRCCSCSISSSPLRLQPHQRLPLSACIR